MPLSELSLIQRSKAVAGSDTPHLMNLAPYGCVRRLWYDKKGVPADHPFRGNKATRRGDVMEEVARVEYFEATARGVRKPHWKEHPRIGYFGCHADGLQEIEECGPKSILEIKCPSARVFYAARGRDEPPNEAWLQAQWCMAVHELDAGTVLLFCADSFDMRYWDFAADPAIQDDLGRMAKEFWATLRRPDNPFPKLPDGDPRCGKCPWRGVCKGLTGAGGECPEELAARRGAGEVAATDPAAAEEAVLEFVAAKAMAKDAETQLELAKARLQSLFTREGKITTAVGAAVLSRVRRKAYTAEVKATTYLSLRFVPNKEVEESFYDVECDG